MTRLTVAVFSFNRGAYLANCVASLQRNLPWADLLVYDDGSDDPATRAVLQGLGVPVDTAAVGDMSRHGGLYGNMQRALDQVTTEYILFLQEDMQVVRPFTAGELAVIDSLFAEAPRRAFVCPVFMKGIRASRHHRRLVPHGTLRAYVGNGHANGSIYSDVAIGHVARLRAAGWRFQPSEAASTQVAAAQFADMPYMADPFAFYCPEVPVFRNRSQSLSARLAAKVTGVNVKSLVDMTQAETRSFVARSLEHWPVAEDFLTASDPNVRKPFVYKDVKARWWLNVLYRLERLRRG